MICTHLLYYLILYLTKHGDDALGSVRLSNCLFLCALLFEPFDLGP